MTLHGQQPCDPIRRVESAIVTARAAIAAMREDNFASIQAAHAAIVKVGDFTFDALRQIEAAKPRA